MRSELYINLQRMETLKKSILPTDCALPRVHTTSLPVMRTTATRSATFSLQCSPLHQGFVNILQTYAGILSYGPIYEDDRHAARLPPAHANVDS